MPAVLFLQLLYLVRLRLVRSVNQISNTLTRTPWQTTHIGIPSPSSHSPGPSGIVTGPFELVSPPAPAELGSMPLFLSRHSVMVSSITIFVSSSSETSICRSRRTHSLSCRTQVHGSVQSSNITTKVSGILCGVRSGLRRGAKAGEGSERRYADTRARVSCIPLATWERGQVTEGSAALMRELHTFLVSIQHILIRVSKGELVRDGWYPSPSPLVRQARV